MRCFFGFHKWGKWRVETFTFQYRKAGVPIGEPYSKDIQLRECELCGKKQTEEL